jgi:hypothetical protein
MSRWISGGVIAILLAVTAVGLFAQESTDEPSEPVEIEASAEPETPAPADSEPTPAESPVIVSEEAPVQPTEEATLEPTDTPPAEASATIPADATEPVEVTPQPTAEVTESATVDPALLVQPTIIFADPAELGLTARSSTIPAPSLRRPDDNSVVGEERVNFEWNSVSGADLYQLQVATTADFADGTILIDIETNRRSYRLGGSQTLAEGDFFWRVRSREAASQQWGEFGLLPRTLRLHMLRSPGDNAFTTDTTPAFSWNAHDRAINYRLLLATDDTFGSPVAGFPFITNRTSAGIGSSSPLPFGVYYWRVDLDYGAGFVESPFYFTFTVTPRPPQSPSMVNPANRLLSADPLPVFDWLPTTSTEGTPFEYQLEFATDSRFRSGSFIVTVDGTTYTPGADFPDGRWYWRARTINYLDAPGAWSRSREFTIDTTNPDIPDLFEPTNSGETSDSTPRLRWERIADAVQYQVRLNTGGTPIILVTSTNRTDYTPSTPLLFTLYSWQVQAIDAAGNESGWGTPFTFNVVSPGNAAPLLNRADGAQMELTWTPISWALGYQVQVANNRSFPTSSLVQDETLPPSETAMLTDPLPDGIFYWRVRAQRPDGRWGGWSTMGTFAVED